MSHFPPSPLQLRRRKILRRLGMALSGIMMAMVLIIFAMILRSERAHDESKCPFARRSERELRGARVVEEARSCLPETEEHRWLVERPGKPAYELARKRLSKERFTPDRAKWVLSEDEHGKLVIAITVDGQPASEFREADVPAR